LIVQRHELDGTLLAKDLDENVYHDYAKLMEEETEVCEAVPVPSNHPLYILYTSGTTGAPKGVVRDHGGTCVSVQWAIRNIFNCGKGDTFQAMSDIGWVVGHTNIVYGPLLTCSKSVFFEGKPITPNPGIVWELCAKYKTKVLYMAPTGLRVIKKMDYEAEYVQKFDLTALETFHVVGERCDPDTIKWSHRHLKDTMLNDTWWQTETGWPMAGNMFNIEEFGKIYPTLPGSVSRPIPGYDLKVFDEANQEVPAGTLGKIVIKMPMPPSFMLTLWGNDEAFV
jgi:propionyl-CoA synthetase